MEAMSMKNLILLVLLALVGVHAYFYLSFGTLDPCKAAATRMIDLQSSEAGRTLGQLVAGPIESRLRAKGMTTCYRAMFDQEPEALLQ